MLAAFDFPRDAVEDRKAVAHHRKIVNVENGRAGHEQEAAGERYPTMSTERKPEDPKFKPTEKEAMSEPQEEFVADQSVPSKDLHEVQDIHEGREVPPPDDSEK